VVTIENLTEISRYQQVLTLRSKYIILSGTTEDSALL